MIAIVDYDAGNLTSVARAISYLGIAHTITNDPSVIAGADRVVFPGVGAAGSAMKSLKEKGLDIAIRNAVSDGRPVLGICLGTQIIMSVSEEDDASCLDIVQGCVKAFPADMVDAAGDSLKIPHMGWNSLDIKKDHPVLKDLSHDDEFYFVHGFYPSPAESGHIIGTTEYGIVFPSVIGFNNLIATQFHPEKSGEPGLLILKNFCEWTPC